MTFAVTDSSSLGPFVVHVCPSDWCVVGRVGEALVPFGHRLLHLRPDPPHETQPLVGHCLVHLA